MNYSGDNRHVEAVNTFIDESLQFFDNNLLENLIDITSRSPLKSQPQAVQNSVLQSATDACSTPLKHNSCLLNSNVLLNSNAIRTPTPLKNAIAKIKLQDEQMERIRQKGLVFSSQQRFSDSGYVSFHNQSGENHNSNFDLDDFSSRNTSPQQQQQQQQQQQIKIDAAVYEYSNGSNSFNLNDFINFKENFNSGNANNLRTFANMLPRLPSNQNLKLPTKMVNFFY